MSSPRPSTSSISDAGKSVVSKKRNEDNKISLSAENRTIKLVKKPRIVLDEDDFTGELEKIIVRDYFPEVPRLKAQHAYLDAVANNDIERVRELQLRYSSNFTNGSDAKTVRRFNLNGGRFDVDTDMEEVLVNPEGLNEELDSNKSNVDIEKHTVQTFVDTFVSEDSKSFHDLMDYEDKRRRAQFEWIYKAEEKHNAALIHRGPEMLADADKQLMQRKEPGDERPNDIDNWAFKAKNAVLFELDGAAPTLREFMDAVKNDNSKIINKAATRIDTSTINWKNTPTPSNQFISSKVDITGKQMDPRSNIPGRFQPIETPNPTIGPDETPFVTWGQIDGTPFRLDGSDMTPLPDHAPVFKLPEMTKREIIAHEMADKLKRQNKEKKMFSKRITDKLRDPHTRLSTSSRMSMMSPAAHKFATTKLGIRTKGTGSSSKKTPSSVHLPSFSIRPGSRSTLKTPTMPGSSSIGTSSIKLDPMENVINEKLLSVRSKKHQFH